VQFLRAGRQIAWQPNCLRPPRRSAHAKRISEAVRRRQNRVILLTIMPALRDIKTPEDVRTLVDRFYAKVNRDDLLAPIFNEVAKVDWQTHLPQLYRFWETLLFGSGNYEGAPFPKHAVLPLDLTHFERWLILFTATVDENFSGTKAEEAKGRAFSIADTFARRMGLLKSPVG
jgi:hemoglobin